MAYVLIVLVLFALYLIHRVFLTKVRAPLPPGPKRLPLVGNIADLPPSGMPEYLHWLKHKDLYGPISSVTAFGQNIMIINDESIALELMEKRSVKHSARPNMEFAMNLVGWKDSMAGQQNSSTLRKYRRNAHSIIGTKETVSKFWGLQTEEVGRFLLSVLKYPKDLEQHLKSEAGAVILQVIYGYTAERHGHDPLVHLVEETMSQFSEAAIPGKWLVDMIPILKYAPEWLPGARQFQKSARLWRQTLNNAVNVPYMFVKNQMTRHMDDVSFVSRLLFDLQQKAKTPTSEEEHIIKWSALSLYAGGSDTTVAALRIFFLAMTLYPEVQQKAQQELDRVVGTSRLTTFEDRKNLPYIDAVVRETFRWHPLAPLGLPHMTDQDDVFNGYLIPKGSILIPNIWWFCHDPAVYKDPDTFNPDRFLGPNPEPDISSVFGFGRRICPGRLLADSTIFLTVAQSLSVFKISKGIDQLTGEEIEIEQKFVPGIVSHPEPYETTIKPRNKEAEALINSLKKNYVFDEGDSKLLGKF